METCDVSAVATCMWCHADSRNNLTLAVSPDLKKWTVISTVLKDDTGVPRFISEVGTGFSVDRQWLALVPPRCKEIGGCSHRSRPL